MSFPPPPLTLQIHVRSSRVIDTAKTLHFVIPVHDSCRHCFMHFWDGHWRTLFQSTEYMHYYSGWSCRILDINNALEKKCKSCGSTVWQSSQYPRSPSRTYPQSLIRSIFIWSTRIVNTSPHNTSPDHYIYHYHSIYASAQYSVSEPCTEYTPNIHARPSSAPHPQINASIETT